MICHLDDQLLFSVVGGYDFKRGSTLGLFSTATGEMTAQVAMNTTITAATGGIVAFLTHSFILKVYYDIGGLCNGILADPVSITAPFENVASSSSSGTRPHKPEYSMSFWFQTPGPDPGLFNQAWR